MQAARIRKMLMAAIVADAFGVPAEGQQRGTYQLTQLVGGGIWRQPIGSWSDDTSMSLALMAHLTAGDTYGDLMVRFANYIFKGDYTPNQEAFGVGRTCRQAVRNYFYAQVPATAAGSN